MVPEGGEGEGEGRGGEGRAVQVNISIVHDFKEESKMEDKRKRNNNLFLPQSIVLVSVEIPYSVLKSAVSGIVW